MKIYLNKIREDWIIDRVKKEFSNYFKGNVTNNINKADIIWIIAPWAWEQISTNKLKRKKVICSYYHFDFSSFDREKFNELDKHVDEYHVISNKTKLELGQLTNKKINFIPFWIDEKKFFYIAEKNKLRQKFKFNYDDYLVGSFQRDTEGNDLKSPKLVKGPDIFLNIVESIYKENHSLKVVLTGKRRQFVVQGLKNLNIPYKLFEMVNFKKLNQLYNILDLYIVSSRIEGGPQAIMECGQAKTPIISTDVGIASEILSPESIYSPENFKIAKPNVEVAFNNSSKYLKDIGLRKFIRMFEEIYEN